MQAKRTKASTLPIYLYKEFTCTCLIADYGALLASLASLAFEGDNLIFSTFSQIKIRKLIFLFFFDLNEYEYNVRSTYLRNIGVLILEFIDKVKVHKSLMNHCYVRKSTILLFDEIGNVLHFEN